MTTPAAVSALLQAAARCQQAGQLQEAERLCGQVLAAVPRQPDALHLLAVICAQNRRYAEANDFFARALAAAPARADFHGNYANALWEQGRIDEAAAACKRSIALDARRAEAHNILGNALLAQGQAAEAASCFRRALVLRPAYPHALNNLGNALQKQGSMEEAVSAYRQALVMLPDYPEAHNNLGLALKALGKIGEAASSFRHALSLHPDFSQAAANFAEVDPAWLEPLEGKKLRLRRYREEDAAYLRGCFQDAGFMARYNHNIPRHQSLEELAKKLRKAQDAHPCQSRAVDWIILKKDGEQPVGIANLVEIQFAHRRAEFLIGLPDTADRTSGIGLEAALLVLDFSFNKVGLNKLTTLVYGDNLSSQQNTLALGFVQESHLREHLAEPDSGRFLDLYGNGMTQGDFRANARLARLSPRLLGWDATKTKETKGHPLCLA